MWFSIMKSNIDSNNGESLKDVNSRITGEQIVAVLNLTHILPEDRDDRRWYIKLCIKRGGLPNHRYSSISKAWLDDYMQMMQEDMKKWDTNI